ncbi:hypothetical protein [Pedobacter panaciterrae]|uniref:hypothetical protein n=1 Tax=Pedobacter panaciterrae TaxID=363849 RepID=UPI002596EF22|nr:hypothetical protein [uncultured Pedobacter sp.]
MKVKVSLFECTDGVGPIFDNKDNGFQRRIKTSNFNAIKEIQLPPGLFYFAGIGHSELYFKNLDIATAVYSVDFALTALQKNNLTLKADVNIKNKSVNIGVVDTATFVTGSQSGTLTIIPKTGSAVRYFKNPDLWLDQTSLLSTKAMVGRAFTLNRDKLQMKLIRFDYYENKIEREYPLKEQKSGIFSTDGILQADQAGKKLFYVYFYKGEFLALDTNLSVRYSAKTIDTITGTAANIVTLNQDFRDKKEAIVTQANPPKVLNRSYTLYQNRIYILSTLKSDNETSSAFRKNQVIDVYREENGKYIYSFYIPKYKGKKLREIRISGNAIFALFDDVLVKYQQVIP